MVGLLGCGCCGCCTEPTSVWNEPFTSTPTPGITFDEVEEIEGPGARSYAPARAFNNTTKTSRIKINPEDAFPLLLSVNPRQTRGGATFLGSVLMNNTHPTKVNRSASWTPAPPPIGGTSTMGVDLFQEFLFDFEGDEYKTGIATKWSKSETNGTMGVKRSYTQHYYGYYQVNSGPVILQSQAGPGTVPATQNDFVGPYIYAQYWFDFMRIGAASIAEPECKKLTNVKRLRADSLASGSWWLANLNDSTFELNDKKFSCFVGMETRVVWKTTTTASFSGSFDFSGSYLEWDPFSWS